MKALRPGLPHLGTPAADRTIPASDAPRPRTSASTWLLGRPGLPGRVALSWALAGGLTMEAILVVAALMSGVRAATSDPLAATVFFLVGVVGGFVHGGLVGVVGRADDVSLRRALLSVERAALATVPLSVLTWGAALWISLTGTEAARGRPGLLLAVGVGWVTLAGVGIWALREGGAALRHTLVRWPMGPGGAAVLGLVSVVLVISFVWWRPEIWFTDVRTTPLGAAMLALGVTIWFALPLLALGIHLLHRRDRTRATSAGREAEGSGPRG